MEICSCLIPYRVWSFCWVKIRSCFCGDIRTIFKLSCLNFLLSIFMIQSSLYRTPFKSCQRHCLFHPWVVIKILRQKSFFQIMNRIDYHFCLLCIFIILFVNIKLISLTKIIELFFYMRLIIFVLISTLRL